MHVHEGRCHCGSLKVEYSCPDAPEHITPRACGCSFCTRHGAQWTSSTHGRLRIRGDVNAHHAYRFGTATADFHICRNCGVVLAATSEIDGRLYAVVNLAVMDPSADSYAGASTSNFDDEALDDRLQRRASRWIPDVRIELE